MNWPIPRSSPRSCSSLSCLSLHNHELYNSISTSTQLRPRSCPRDTRTIVHIGTEKLLRSPQYLCMSTRRGEASLIGNGSDQPWCLWLGGRSLSAFPQAKRRDIYYYSQHLCLIFLYFYCDYRRLLYSSVYNGLITSVKYGDSHEPSCGNKLCCEWLRIVWARYWLTWAPQRLSGQPQSTNPI